MEVTGETLMSNDEQHEKLPAAENCHTYPPYPPRLPDCQDLPLDNFSDRIEALAEDRGNAACGDPRMFKAGYVRELMMDSIHQEARSSYLAGYLQATQDLQE